MFFTKRADDANATIKAPVSVPASGDFDGNDGKWSSFFINVGDDATGHGQNFKVLISTSSPVTTVPQQSGGCDEDCAKSRGIEIFNAQQPLGYESSSSKAWKELGIFNLPMPDWWFDSKPNGTWGTDNIGLGESSTASPILANQLLVEYPDQEFWMGSFGLAAGQVNIAGSTKSPFLTEFIASNNAPSTSYGYTAGASYRNNQNGVVGSLILGGYDQSRFDDRKVSIGMPNASNNTLAVGVPSILYKPNSNADANTYSFTAKSSPFSATIDSTLPYLWLPDAVCDEFAEKFQLNYNEDENLYTVNASARNFNRQQNATVSFKITEGPQDSTDNFATIVLPYAAFDLEASMPIFGNTTTYFPLRKSPTGVYVLGRTFLQEAYIIVDYERANFTVAPANVSDTMPQPHIVPIFKKGYNPPQESSAPASDNGLAPGAIAGIVVGIVVAFLLAGLGAFFLWKRRRGQKQKKDQETEKGSDFDTVVAGNEVKHRRVSELDSNAPGSPKPSLAGTYYDQDRKDVVPFPPITEMESPPAELYSPPPPSSTEQTEMGDYFLAGHKVRRRGATRESSGNNTPGTPAAIAELPGDDGKFQVGGMHFEPVASPKQSPKLHSRSPSDTSLSTNIDAVVMATPDLTTETSSKENSRPKSEEEAEENKKDNKESEQQAEPTLERRPSHTRGLSDTTVQSDSTAVSQPTPEELESWSKDNEPRRPLSE